MKTLIDLFDTFEERGSKTVFIYRKGIRRLVFSYGELSVMSKQASSWYEQKGVGKGDRVAIWAPNSPWWAVAFWGAILRGAIVVPLDFASNMERAQAIAKIIECKIIFQSNFKLDKINALNCFELEDLEYLVKNFKPAVAANNAEETDTAELIYTSGTTGDPKGAALTHKNLISNLIQVNQHLPIITKDFNFLSVLPLSHMFEQTAGFFTPLFKGSKIIFIRTLKPSAIMEALAEENIYAMVLVPRLLQLLKNSIQKELENKPWIKHFSRIVSWGVRKKLGKNFKLFVSGGAALDLETNSFWKKLKFLVVEGYGLSECSPVLTANTISQQKPGSAGRAIPGVSLKLEDGEILAKGLNIFPGYWKEPEKSNQVFTDDGWFKTGDLGEIDAEGWLFIKGRKKDMIVTSAGIKVYPDDIEAVLNTIEGVKESCVVGKNGANGEEVHAVLILKQGASEPEIIIKQANAKLDSLQQIQGFSLWPDSEFPKTATLKIQKFKVQQKLFVSDFPAQTQNSDVLINIIAKVTGRSVGQISENSVLAADLGLTSISRLELVNFLEQEFRLDLDDAIITNSTRVLDLRAAIAGGFKTRKSLNLHLWPNSVFGSNLRLLFNWLINYPVFFGFVKLRKLGLENLENIKNPVFFVSNHVSYFDHPAVIFSLPHNLRYNTASAAREEFFLADNDFFIKIWKKLAFWYSIAALNVFILPKTRGFRKSLEFMGKLADRGTNMLLFPEGERSSGKTILPFMEGLGLMVKELQIGVIPVKIEGMEEVFPRGAKLPKKGTVTVRFGKLINFTTETPSEIVQKSREAVINL